MFLKLSVSFVVVVIDIDSYTSLPSLLLLLCCLLFVEHLNNFSEVVFRECFFFTFSAIFNSLLMVL